MDVYRKIMGAILLVSLVFVGFLKPVQDYIGIPKELVLFQGQHATFPSILPAMANVTGDSDDASIAIGPITNQDQASLSLKAVKSGDGQITFDLDGLPLKKVNVKVLKDFKVIPGGQSIGVKLNSVGILVVGHHLISTEEGKKSPGELAGIQVGDIITKINNKKIEQMADVAPFVSKSGETQKPLQVEIVRDEQTIQTELLPLKDIHEKKYKIGLYIRDSAAGIGTMTFFDPKSKKYGALGHVISDMDTKKPIVVHDGHIVRSTVTSIHKGSNGNPGEKLARFSNETEIIGNITRNSPFGIFGELNKGIQNGVMDKAIPIALSHQVKDGPAKILTVVEGEKVKEFDVEIMSSVPQKFPATKGMVLKITDPDLLDSTGGIVQGMSGSPIIQDGKLIGAVTHVFVNDPTSGYGVHIEWMLNEAGIDIYEQTNDEEREAS